MREAHAHIAAFGQSLNMPNLAACASLAECLDQVRDSASNTAPGTWIRMLGARPQSWPERRWPTITELDRAAPHRPLIILSFDHHEAVASTAAFRAAGVQAGDVIPPKGVVQLDSSGNLTGLLQEDAAYRVWGTAPEPDLAESRANVLRALVRFAELGYTQVDDLHSQEWLGECLAELEHAGELPVQCVRLYPNVRKLQSVHAGRERWASDRVVLAGGKLFSDGTLNSRTALMLHPYRQPLDGQPLGRAMATPDEIRAAVALTESLKLHLAVHAIGDGAVRMVLDAIAEASSLPSREAARRDPGRRHRIEHCELIDAADVPRFAAMNVVCSVQPCHLLTDIEVLTDQLPHRLERVLPLRELIDAGCLPADAGHTGLLWFGSDAPIVRPEPCDSLLAATKRRRADMPETQAIAIEQRLDEATAYRCFGKQAHGGPSA